MPKYAIKYAVKSVLNYASNMHFNTLKYANICSVIPKYFIF